MWVESNMYGMNGAVKCFDAKTSVVRINAGALGGYRHGNCILSTGRQNPISLPRGWTPWFKERFIALS